MSYDLVVFNVDHPLSVEEAADIYSRLCDGDTTGLGASAKIDEFTNELNNKYPALDQCSDDEVDNCPWSCAFDSSPCHVIMNCVHSQSAEIEPFVISLARKYGLVFFNPQTVSVKHATNYRGDIIANHIWADEKEKLQKMGNTLRKLGDLQLELGRVADAEKSYRESIQAHKEVLGQAPLYVDAHYTLAHTLRKLADLSCDAENWKDARDEYQMAQQSYDRVLAIEPFAVDAYFNKASVLRSCAEAHKNLDNRNDAVECCENALTALVSALKLNDTESDTFYLKGKIYESLAHLKPDCSEECERYWNECVAAYDQALHLSPNDPLYLRAKCFALEELMRLIGD